MRFIKAVIVLVLFMMGLLFLTQNQDPLSTPLVLKYDLYLDGWSWPSPESLASANPPSIPFYFVILLSMAAGILLSTLFFFMDKVRYGVEKVRNRRAIKVLTNEIKRLHGALERKDGLLAANNGKPMLEDATKTKADAKSDANSTPATKN